MTIPSNSSSESLILRRLDGPGYPPYDPQRRAHLWIMSAVFEVSPQPDSDIFVTVGGAGMLSVDGPGCYFCERVFSWSLAEQDCSGPPPSLRGQ